MEVHVTLIPRPKVHRRIFRPLIGLSEKHTMGELSIDMTAQRLQEGMCLRQIFTARPVALVEIGDRIEPQPIHPHAEPKIQHLHDGALHLGALIVQVRLVGVEAVPIIGVGDRVPGPVRRFEILEDNAGVLVRVWGLTPYIKVPPAAAGLGPAGALEPGVLVGGMVHHQFGNNAQSTLVRCP